MIAATRIEMLALMMFATPEMLEGWTGQAVVLWYADNGDHEPCVVSPKLDHNDQMAPHLMTQEMDWWWPIGGELHDVFVSLANASVRDHIARLIFAKLYPGRNPDRFDMGESTTPWWLGWRHRSPGLAGLDPDDPRVLPDGSRWVDAMAMSILWESLR